MSFNMQHRKMADLAKSAGQDPQLLLRRPRGQAVYPHLEAALQSVDEGELLLVSFSEDQDCDPSFIDETLVKLAQKLIKGEFGERGLALTGLNEGISLSLSSTLTLRRDDARKLKEDFKVNFLTFDNQPSSGRLPAAGWKVAGQLEQSLEEVLQLLSRRESLTAADLVKELDLEISSASMRLKRLHERHLVRRQYQTLSTGREFVYSFWL